MSDGWGDDSAANNDGWDDQPSGGSSGGRGRGGDNNTCFKCNESGHRARDCPSGGGSGDNSCRKCGETGHFARECPSQKSDDQNEGCRICNESGHFARECPKKDACRRCGVDGHKAVDCPEPEKTRTIKTVKEDGTEVTREIYVPVERNDDLFGNEINAGINFKKYANIPVEVTGDDVVAPIKTFQEAGLRPLVMENIEKCGYEDPTPVQKSGIPIVMAGRDLMACAQTGSGKTAAFLVPMVSKFMEEKAERHTGAECQTPQAVVISPTRELANQIQKEAKKFCQGSMIRPVMIYGGTSVRHQHDDILRGCNILIATPGRLKDFVDRGWVAFSELKYLVLDEADRMLDMGFSADIKELVNHRTMPAKTERVTLLFSATFPIDVQKAAQEYLNNYLFLRVGVVGGACSDVEQTIMEVDKTKKRDELVKMLTSMSSDSKVMVFVNTKKMADFLASYICSEGLRATSIHGDRYQSQREEALYTFRTGQFPILVATAVAARGLDIKGVDMVINYDMPSCVDEYVHRIGRTGRMGNIGRAISMFEPTSDANIAGGLLRILSEAEQEVPEFLANCARGGFSGGGGDAFESSKDLRGGAAAASNEDDEWN